ncbi:MAG: HAMP domain-containing histidine kinase [Patescibacteria group bacterium]|nr:HAMP domain-containing histidine kinase [Patescibacteria group bacterium]
MNEKPTEIEKRIHRASILIKILGSGTSLFALYIIAGMNLNLPSTFDPQMIRLFTIIAFYWFFLTSVLGYYLFSRGKKVLGIFRYAEYLGGAILLSLILHHLGRINGPFVFIYLFIIIGGAYNLSIYLPYLVAIIGSLSLAIEFLYLLQTGEIVFNLFTVISLLLRAMILFFTAYYSTYLVSSIRSEKKERNELDKLYKTLEKNYEELKKTDKIKGDFIRIISHQMRTPLTLVKGYLEMFNKITTRKSFTKEETFFLDQLNQGVVGLSNVVGEVIDVSSIEAGRFGLTLIPTNISRLVEDKVKLLSPQVKEKPVELIYEKPKEEITATIDEEKIGRVISYFIENAISYTEKGQIKITLKKEKNNFVFKVADTGIGIKIEDKLNIFHKFYRSDNAVRIRPDGTGLQLYLAKEIVEKHEGEIIFESKEKKGSLFGFKIPLTLKESKKAKDLSPQEIDKMLLTH